MHRGNVQGPQPQRDGDIRSSDRPLDRGATANRTAHAPRCCAYARSPIARSWWGKSVPVQQGRLPQDGRGAEPRCREVAVSRRHGLATRDGSARFAGGGASAIGRGPGERGANVKLRSLRLNFGSMVRGTEHADGPLRTRNHACYGGPWWPSGSGRDGCDRLGHASDLPRGAIPARVTRRLTAAR